MPALQLPFYFTLCLASLFILGKSADFLVVTITRVGHYLRLSQFVTGFILLGIATSIPEFSIALNSVLAATPQLSLGNLLGANIVLVTLIAGSVAIISPTIYIKQELSHPDRLIHIILLILAPLVLLLDSHLSRLDGLFLCLLYIGYLIYTYRLRPANSPSLEHQLRNEHVLGSLFLAITGLLGVVLSSKAVIFSSLQLAHLLHIPPLAIGVILLSLGTNIPEISVALAAIRHHHTNLVIGDVLGSAATNTFIAAVLGLLSPFAITSWPTFPTLAVFMILAFLLFFIFTRTGRRLSPKEGLVLLAVYIAFLTSEVSSLVVTSSPQ